MNQFRPCAEIILAKRISRGGIENRWERQRHTIRVRARKRKFEVRQLLKGTNDLKCVLADPSLPSPAPEILDYLARHPDAQDTIDGILHWWVLDAYVKKCAPKIAKTVAKLVEQGFLEQKRSADGNVFYRASPDYLATLQQRPPDSTPDGTP